METEDRRAILLTGGIITVAILLGCARRKRDPEPLDAGGGYPGPGDTYGTPTGPENGYVPAAGGGTYGTPSPGATPTGPAAPGAGAGGGASTPNYAPSAETGAGLTMAPGQYATAAGQGQPTMLFNGAAGQQQASAPRSSVMTSQAAPPPQAYVNWQLVEEDEDEDSDTTYTPYVTPGLST